MSEENSIDCVKLLVQKNMITKNMLNQKDSVKYFYFNFHWMLLGQMCICICVSVYVLVHVLCLSHKKKIKFLYFEWCSYCKPKKKQKKSIWYKNTHVKQNFWYMCVCVCVWSYHMFWQKQQKTNTQTNKSMERHRLIFVKKKQMKKCLVYLWIFSTQNKF